MRILLLFLCLLTFSVSAQTNYIDVPGGSPVLATSDAGFYWCGFAIGFGFYVVGMVLKMSKRVVGGSYD